MPSLPQELSGFLSRVLQCCLEIRFIWLIGEDDKGSVPGSARWELLTFADGPTLQRLRKAADLHRADVDMLVVTDGDCFENAWGPRRRSGSLVRWAWRQGADGDAYYNESRWAGGGDEGAVVRVRRRAILLWQAEGPGGDPDLAVRRAYGPRDSQRLAVRH